MIAAFGGTAPLLAATFVGAGHPMYVAVYMTVIVALCLIVYFTLPETGNRGERATVAPTDPEVLEGRARGLQDSVGREPGEAFPVEASFSSTERAANRPLVSSHHLLTLNGSWPNSGRPFWKMSFRWRAKRFIGRRVGVETAGQRRSYRWK